MILASSETAKRALTLLKKHQSNFANLLCQAWKISEEKISEVDWLRSGGENGGGNRLVIGPSEKINTASINFSQVHYEEDANRQLSSATALSTIIHPSHPIQPSTHIHVSLTEMKTGKKLWRVMGDLNPSHSNEEDKKDFAGAISQLVDRELFEHGRKQGDKYFFIPALERHRGVFHFYLEGYEGETEEAGFKLADKFLATVTKCYSEIIGRHETQDLPLADGQRDTQLDYHSLYFYQVLLLDRGTTSGILVHNENDQGILGSIPSKVNLDLLRAWSRKSSPLQNKLMTQLIEVFDADSGIVTVGESEKQRLVDTMRQFYTDNPQALELQAAGFTVPPTVKNHNATS